VACSLTDVLSLLPASPQPFTLGPRDYLHQFMTLLSVLRNGDNRFLPLLLSKVHDVLPTLANPMLQTVPDSPATMCAEVDIFDGFGPINMGVASNYISNSSPSDYKMSQPEFKIENPAIPPYDKRIEEISSPTHGPESGEAPFTSPPIISPGLEFPGISEYNPFPDLNSQGMGNGFEGVGGRQVDFKREFDGGLGLGTNGVPMRSPLRQDSVGSYGLPSPGGIQIPRSVPEQFHHAQLQRTNSGGQDRGMNGVVNGAAFR
jgi:hypothetical protein